MPNVVDSRGREYNITGAQLLNWEAGNNQFGPDWGDTYLASIGSIDMAPPLTSPSPITGNPRWLEEYMVTRSVTPRRKKAPEEPVAALTLPVIPEVGDDGVKRLYKTRYNQLEALYTDLHSRHAKLQKSHVGLQQEYEDLASKYTKLEKENQRLTLVSAEGTALDKRIDHLCKEAQISMPVHTFRVQQTLEQKLDAFFGAILCRLRIEEPVDELAD